MLFAADVPVCDPCVYAKTVTFAHLWVSMRVYLDIANNANYIHTAFVNFTVPRLWRAATRLEDGAAARPELYNPDQM